MKTVMVTLSEDMLETEIGKAATVTIESKTYNGAVTAIIVHQETPAKTTVTLEGPGLKAVEP